MNTLETEAIEQLNKRVRKLEAELLMQQAEIAVLTLLAATPLAEAIKHHKNEPVVRAALMNQLEKQVGVHFQNQARLQHYDNAVDALLAIARRIRDEAYLAGTKARK